MKTPLSGINLYLLWHSKCLHPEYVTIERISFQVPTNRIYVHTYCLNNNNHYCFNRTNVGLCSMQPHRRTIDYTFTIYFDRKLWMGNIYCLSLCHHCYISPNHIQYTYTICTYVFGIKPTPFTSPITILSYR